MRLEILRGETDIESPRESSRTILYLDRIYFSPSRRGERFHPREAHE